MKTLHMIAYMLLWVGGLNWGLVGLFDYNLVEMIVPAGMVQLVYVAVGAATVYVAVTHKSDCKVCGKK